MINDFKYDKDKLGSKLNEYIDSKPDDWINPIFVEPIYEEKITIARLVLVAVCVLCLFAKGGIFYMPAVYGFYRLIKRRLRLDAIEDSKKWK